MNRNPRNYGFSTYQRRYEPSEEKILVFDLGGGTFDVTVLHVINGSDSLTFRVLATGGDDMLGGTNFDEAFRDWALQEGEIDFSSVDERAKNRSMAGLLEEVIKIKQELSFVESTFLAVPNILPGQHLDLDVSQTRFNETIIDVCIANDPVVPAGTWTSGLPLEALRSLAMQGSIIRTLRFGEGAGDLPEFGSELRRNGPS